MVQGPHEDEHLPDDFDYDGLDTLALSDVDEALAGVDLLSTLFSLSFVLSFEEGAFPLSELLALPFLLSVT